MPYKIALLNEKFDTTYKDVIRFNDRASQYTFFDIPAIFNNAISLQQFRFNNMLETAVTYRYNTVQNINDLLSNNYCIIYDESVTDESKLKYYFYFINSTNYDASNSVVILQLQLDVIQTYYIDLTFSNCLIQRAHLSRFYKYNITDNGANFFYDNTFNSLMFINETSNKSKRLVSRKELKCGFVEPLADTTTYTKNSVIENWLLENVDYWIYYYIKNDNAYKFYSLKDSSEKTASFQGSMYTDNENKFNSYSIYLATKLPYNIVCVPKYKTWKRLTIETNADGVQNILHIQENIDSFLNANNGETSVFSIKTSIIPPSLAIYQNSNIDSNGNLNITVPCDDDYVFCGDIKSTRFYNINSSSNETMIYQYGFLMNNRGYPMYAIDNTDVYSRVIDIPNYNISVSSSEIKNANKSYIFNPKLQSQNYRELKITNDISGFIYDLQKLNRSHIYLRYVEFLSPDITKFYCYIDLSQSFANETNPIFITDTIYNYTGLVSDIDLSMPYSIAQIDTFLANNKNFYLQKYIESGSNIAKSFVSGKGITGITNAGISGAVNIVNANLTVDNMRNAPESLQHANGNAYFNMSTVKPFLYIELYECLPEELNRDNDYMNEYGYSYNHIDNVKNCDNIRKFFNYIQADIEIINCNKKISNVVRNRIRQIFSNGIRFWNYYNNDLLFSFDKENYENLIDEVTK